MPSEREENRLAQTWKIICCFLGRPGPDTDVLAIFFTQFLYVGQNALVLQATTFRGVVCASEPAFQHFHVFTAMQTRVGFVHSATSRERLQTSRTIVPGGRQQEIKQRKQRPPATDGHGVKGVF